jgi:hypothetical protein
MLLDKTASSPPAGQCSAPIPRRRCSKLLL